MKHKSINADVAPAQAGSTHTPGPWYCNLQANGYPATEIIRAGKGCCDGPVKIAECFYSASYDARANARLIASAPDLLAALEECVESLTLYLQSVEDGKDDDAESAYQHGFAAIAHARSQ